MDLLAGFAVDTALDQSFVNHNYNGDINYLFFAFMNRPAMDIRYQLVYNCYASAVIYQAQACQKVGLELLPIFSNKNVSRQEANTEALEIVLKNYTDTIISTPLENVTKWDSERFFFQKRSTENLELVIKYEKHCSFLYLLHQSSCNHAASKLYDAAMTNAASYEEADSRTREAAKEIDFISNAKLSDSDLLQISELKFTSRSWKNLELSLKIERKCRIFIDICPSYHSFIKQTMDRTDLSDDAKDKTIFDFFREKHPDVLEYKLPDEDAMDVSMRRFRDSSMESKELMDRVDFCVDRFSNDTRFGCLDFTRKVYSVLRTNSTLPDDQIKTIIFKLVEPYDFLHKPNNNQSGNPSSNNNQTSSESLPGSNSLHSSNFVDSLKWSTFSLAVSLASALFLL